MEFYRFQQLLNGDELSLLSEFADFLLIIEMLPNDLLWKLHIQHPALNIILRDVVLKTLQERISRDNVENSLSAITASVTTYLSQK